MNNHVATTLPFLVEDLGVGLESPEKKAGNRPAHTAVIWGHNDVVAYLLARGARHDAENLEGMTLAPMARRRQALLVGGTQAERAYYARNGVPLDYLVDEGARLVRMLDGVEHAGSWDAWASGGVARPRRHSSLKTRMLLRGILTNRRQPPARITSLRKAWHSPRN